MEEERKKKMNLSCLIYIRVSDPKQGRGASLGDQETACKAFAVREGLTVVAVYCDDGKSAWRDEIKHRPAFERLLAAARTGKIGAVLVAKLDRFARKARVFHNARWDLERHGVQLLSATEPNDNGAAGRLSSAMLADFAEFYSAQLSERIRAAQLSKAARGLWVGPAPFGYIVGDNHQLVPAATWLWVVCIFQGYALGATTAELAAALNAAGVPLASGRPWTKDSVLMVLRNHAYIGRAGGRALQAYQAGHRPLVSLALWEEVAAALSERRRRPIGPRRAPRPAPLSYVPLCALCGARMHRHGSTRRYLRCRASLNQTCPARGVELDTVEHQVELLRKSGATINRVWLIAPRGIERFE